MNESSLEVSIAYIHGRIEAQLEGFAASLGIPTRQLTNRVAALLLGSSSREVLGTQDRVPNMRGKAKRRKTPRKVEVAGSASEDKAQSELKPSKFSVACRKRISQQMKKVWREKRKAAKSAA